MVINGKTYTQSGQYNDTITNAAGCDSVITWNLTIHSGGPSVNNITASTCNNYIMNGKIYSTSGTHRDTLFGAGVLGCDSILVLNLTLGRNGSMQTVTTCKNYVFRGTTLIQSGIYYDTLTNVAGCDSVMTLVLTVNNVNVTVTQSGNVLTAAETGATYKWINCATNTEIPGAVSQSFTVTSSGDYKVIITKNECIDTSVCIAVAITPCNLQISHAVTGTERCKDVSLTFSNAAFPVNMVVTYGTANIPHTVNASPYLLSSVCPETYIVTAADANGCTDTIAFMVNEPGVGLNEKTEQHLFRIYPNPVKEVLYVEQLEPSSSTEITVCDIQGRVYLRQGSIYRTMQIDVSDLASGIYWIKVNQPSGFSVI